MDHGLLPERLRRLLPEATDDGTISHVGVLVPWANTVMETELPRLGLTGVTWHYARLVPENEGTALDDIFLAGLVRAIPAALHQLSHLPLGCVALGCTSAAFSFPTEVHVAVTDAGLPVFTAFDALVGALRRLEATRIVLLAPYPADVTKREADAFEEVGIEVIASACLGLRDGFAQITPGAIADMLERRGSATIGGAAVVLSCTAWPTLAAVRIVEQQLGCPVVSSNLAIAVHAATVAIAERTP